MNDEFAKHVFTSIELLNNQVSGMQSTLVSIQKSQEKLFNIVANGNGQPSLIAQASDLKARVKEVEEDVKLIESKTSEMEKCEAACRASVNERLRGIPEPSEQTPIKRYGLWAAIGTGVAAFFIKVGEWLFTLGGSN